MKSQEHLIKGWRDLAKLAMIHAVKDLKPDGNPKRPWPFIKAVGAALDDLSEIFFDDMEEAATEAVIRYCKSQGAEFPKGYALGDAYDQWRERKSDEFASSVTTMWKTISCCMHGTPLSDEAYESNLGTCFYSLHGMALKEILERSMREIQLDNRVKGMGDVDADINGECLYHILYEDEGDFPADVAWAIDDDSISDMHHVLSTTLINHARAITGVKEKAA